MSRNDTGNHQATAATQADGLRALERVATSQERTRAFSAVAAEPLTGPITGPIPAVGNGHRGRYVYPPPDMVVVSKSAVRAFAMHASTLVLAVVLSVVATITILAVLTGGVYLPQYTRLNQPTQVGQLGICVSHHGRIWTPTHAGFCHGGRFIHVQPAISHP